MKKMNPLPLTDIAIDDAFWNRYLALVREEVIPYQWKALNDEIPGAAKSHCLKNFEIAAGRRDGEFYGMCFQDSDLYKWLESVAYCLAVKPDAELEKIADGAISLIGAAQGTDGYLNTYYTLKVPEGRWTNLAWGHEMYCAGHLMEAAVAYFTATGKRAFLDIAIRLADCVDATFGAEPPKRKGYPGHQEIEIGLYKLYEATNEKRFLDLAAYFIRERGKSPHFFDWEREQEKYHAVFAGCEALPRSYSQSGIPPVEQREATGHAVRAAYMYAAMADIAAADGDRALMEACEALYENVVNRQMYITGSIGATADGESFTGAYDLPNDLVYGETCASVALMMFAGRMNAITAKAGYADIVERALYNTVLAGISLNGTEFYYVNPLECDPGRVAVSPDLKHIKTVRQKWFDCSCCPTNIARTIMSIGHYMYGVAENDIYVNLYCSSTVRHDTCVINVKTTYPYGDEAIFSVTGGHFRLHLRNPGNAAIVCLEINGEKQELAGMEAKASAEGYFVIEKDFQDDEIRVVFDMRPKQVFSALPVQNNIGKAAIMRGPLVYCLEEADNGRQLGAFLLPQEIHFSECPAPPPLPDGTVALKAEILKYERQSDDLYTTVPPRPAKAAATLIPYFLWANRGENEMRVYIHSEPFLPKG